MIFSLWKIHILGVAAGAACLDLLYRPVTPVSRTHHTKQWRRRVTVKGCERACEGSQEKVLQSRKAFRAENMIFSGNFFTDQTMQSCTLFKKLVCISKPTFKIGISHQLARSAFSANCWWIWKLGRAAAQNLPAQNGWWLGLWDAKKV